MVLAFMPTHHKPGSIQSIACHRLFQRRLQYHGIRLTVITSPAGLLTGDCHKECFQSTDQVFINRLTVDCMLCTCSMQTLVLYEPFFDDEAHYAADPLLSTSPFVDNMPLLATAAAVLA